jgi:hypothetical protein
MTDVACNEGAESVRGEGLHDFTEAQVRHHSVDELFRPPTLRTPVLWRLKTTRDAVEAERHVATTRKDSQSRGIVAQVTTKFLWTSQWVYCCLKVLHVFDTLGELSTGEFDDLVFVLFRDEADRLEETGGDARGPLDLLVERVEVRVSISRTELDVVTFDPTSMTHVVRSWLRLRKR